MKIKYQISKLSVNVLIFNLIFALFILIFTFSTAFAWKLPLEVSTVGEGGKKVYSKLVIGEESGASDGFDNIWDTQALVSNTDPDSPLVLKAYLKNESEGQEELRQLWKDIRGTAPGGHATNWDIIVESVPAGKSVVISWVVPQGVPGKGERLLLTDNNNKGADEKPAQIDVTQASEYSYDSVEGETRTISLTLSKTKKSRSKSSSGLGCGTIKSQDNDHDGGNWPTDASAVLLLLSPLLFLRFIRLTRLRLSI